MKRFKVYYFANATDIRVVTLAANNIGEVRQIVTNIIVSIFEVNSVGAIIG